MTDRVSPFHSGFVALIGRPNSGKSTLLNAVLGSELAPVTSVPQTTRHRLKGIFTDETRQIIFIDTPGIHKGKHGVNDAMLREAEEAIRGSGIDCVCYLVDLARPFGAEERIVAAYAEKVRERLLIVFNKQDVCEDVDGRKLEFFELFSGLAGVPSVTVAASKGEVKEKFLAALMPFIKEGPRYFDEDSLTDAPMRFFAAEFIRKQAMLATREEVPHAITVEIEFYREEERRHLIAAVIHVETDGQKGIVIGKRGAMLGRIRAAAERDLARLTGCPVQITAHVKVSSHWRDDDRFLRSMFS